MFKCPSKGSKIAHFKTLHRKTGIPYTEMVTLRHLILFLPLKVPYQLFFDDESRNREVEGGFLSPEKDRLNTQ